MARNKDVASAKRFGSRYGRRNRDKYAIAEKAARSSYPCPSCAYPKAKREAVGIWKCQKCGLKFASRAYNVAKPMQLRRQTEEI